MKKIIRIIFSIFISIILSLIVYYGITNKSLLIDIGGLSILTVSSNSMQPELTVGDIIIIKKCSDYKINDIITYSVDEQYLVTHRIIEKEGNNFYTKGDSNNVSDNEIVKIENVKGKLIYNSKLLKLIYKHWLLFVLIVLIIFIVF